MSVDNIERLVILLAKKAEEEEIEKERRIYREQLLIAYGEAQTESLKDWHLQRVAAVREKWGVTG